MHISIWQQFSSNHSGIFRAVGVFASEDKALSASHSLKTLLLRILSWYQEHNAISGDPEGVTPVEHAIAEELGIQWAEGMDWISYGSTPDAVTGAVKQYDRLIEISILEQTWNTRRVFIVLLQRLGASITAGWDRESIETTRDATWVEMTLSCSVADALTAAKLYDTWKERLRFGHIQRDGLHLRFENIPVEPQITLDLLASVRESQCTEIDYHFRAVDYSVKDG